LHRHLSTAVFYVAFGIHGTSSNAPSRTAPYALDPSFDPPLHPIDRLECQSLPQRFRRQCATDASPESVAAPTGRPALGLVDQAYTASMSRVKDGAARNKGVAVGRAADAAMLTLRKDDGAARDAPYTPGVGAGRWQPHPNPVAANPPIANPDLARGYLPSAQPGWGNLTPFTLLSASQFWLPGPPALTSSTYARDFNEVKSLGGKVSTARTDEQTQIARFWFEGPGAHDRAHGAHRPRRRRRGQRPRAGPYELRDGGRLHRGLQDPLRV
jgi:hypothetical protein